MYLTYFKLFKFGTYDLQIVKPNSIVGKNKGYTAYEVDEDEKGAIILSRGYFPDYDLNVAHSVENQYLVYIRRDLSLTGPNTWVESKTKITAFRAVFKILFEDA